MTRLLVRLVRLVRWLRDVKHRPWPPPGSAAEEWLNVSQLTCAADGSSHYFGAGDRCQCGQWPSSYRAIYGARS